MMKSYSVYKDSDIEWIGKIPKHWLKKRIKFLSTGDYKSFIDGDWVELPFITEEGIRLIQTGNVGVGEYREQGYKYISEESFNDLDCTEVFPNDVLICRLASPVGRSCLAPNLGNRMITSVDNCILKPSKLYDSRYIVYQLSSIHYLNYVESISRGGTRGRISRSMLGDIGFIAPPLPEQKQIADYLDRMTNQIDTLIEKKQKLIELLKELRTAIINQAVTKGLDLNAPMKDTGIEWLGEIPKHWGVKRFKHLLKSNKSAIKTGPFGSQLKNTDIVESGMKVYNQRNIIDNNFSRGDDYISEEKFSQLREFEVFPNDILITSRGTIGKCAIFPMGSEKGVLHPCLIRMQIDQNLMLDEYLIWFIQDSVLFQESIFYNSNATTIEVIYSETLKQVQISVPSIQEQKSILKYLNQKTKELDEMIEKHNKSIELLKEYRTTLISEAVTGKIDIRDEVTT